MKERNVILAPTHIYIDTVHGCNYRCPQCACKNIDKVNFMSSEILDLVEESIKEVIEARGGKKVPTIECYVFGEPTLRDDYADIVIRFSPYASKIITVTNGHGIGKQVWSKLIETTSDIFLDIYNHTAPELVEKILSLGWPLAAKGALGGAGSRRAIFDRRVMKGVFQNKWMNYSGLTPPVISKPIEKICSFPFNHFVIRNDGQFGICCADLACQQNLGNIKDMTIMQSWNGVVHRSIMANMVKKNRYFRPCGICDSQHMGCFGIANIHNYEKQCNWDDLIDLKTTERALDGVNLDKVVNWLENWDKSQIDIRSKKEKIDYIKRFQ